MISSIARAPMALFTLILIALSSYASASRILQSNSLNPCPGAKNLGLSATLFNVTFNADAKRLDYNINLVSSIGGKVIANIQALAYGFVLLNQTIDPCDKKNTQLQPLCDMTPGNIPPLNSFSALDQSMVDRIPGIAYAVPDLDVKVRITINDQNRQQIACVETALSNGQTVEQLGVKWATAVIAGLGLVASAVTAGLGHSNTAAHVAANAMSLFGLFQAQAMVGMTSISLPPIVQSWTQDFQWTMGIIKIQFMQTIFTWYLRATGGYPSTIVASLAVASVQVQKRSLEVVQKIADKAPLGILKRAVQKQDNDIKVVRGILRVGFRAGIEPTNIFLTGLAFFVAFLCLVILGILFFKGVLEFGTKRGWSDGEKVQEFRVGWKIVLKGILLRIFVIGYPQITTLCLWELTVRDSAAEVVNALFYFVGLTVILGWGAYKVITIAKRSISLHKNPAYILYSDPTALNKWGFLYVQYRATAYYFIVPQLAYILVKAIFIGLAQSAPIAQAVGILVLEALWLITVCILRPWMDKKTNTFNISIAVILFINAVFLLIFTNVFGAPGMVAGICGVLLFAINAIFCLVLLIMVLVSSVIAIVSRDPEVRYQTMRDNRSSFIKSGSNLRVDELDALGATARGSGKLGDDDSIYSPPMTPRIINHSSQPSTSSTNFSRNVGNNGNIPTPPRSPIGMATPFPPDTGSSNHLVPNHGFGRAGSPALGYSSSAGPDMHEVHYPRTGSSLSQATNRSQLQYRNGAGNGGGNMWQRGAGYEH